MSDVQIVWSLCAECIEFPSLNSSGAVLMESRHGEGRTDKQGLCQWKRKDRSTGAVSVEKEGQINRGCVREKGRTDKQGLYQRKRKDR